MSISRESLVYYLFIAAFGFVALFVLPWIAADFLPPIIVGLVPIVVLAGVGYYASKAGTIVYSFVISAAIVFLIGGIEANTSERWVNVVLLSLLSGGIGLVGGIVERRLRILQH